MTLSAILTQVTPPTPNMSNGDDWFTILVKWFGLPGAMFAIMLYFIGKGTFRTGREAKDKETILLEVIASLKITAEHQRQDYEARLTLMRSDAESRLDRLREDRNYWRTQAQENFATLKQANLMVDKAIEKLPTQNLQPPPPPMGGD